MTVTVEPDEKATQAARPGDVLPVPAQALRELGVAVDPEQDAVAAAARWAYDEVAAEHREASLRLMVAALAGAWVQPRARFCRCVTGRDDLRPSLRQVLLARQLVRAAGEQAASLVAHVCAWVMPSDPGAAVHASHRPQECLALYEAWCWPPDEPLVGPAPASGRPKRDRAGRYAQARAVLRQHVAANAAAEKRPVTEPFTPQRRAEEAELVAWRLGTCLQQIRWVDSTVRQAEIAGALALFEAWKADLPRPDRQALATAVIEAWDAWVATEKARTEAATKAMR